MLKFIGLAVVAVFLISFGYMAHLIQVESLNLQLVNGSQFSITYIDMITVMLTVFAAIFTIVSVGLAAAAVIGWKSIEEKAMATARIAILDKLESDDSELHNIIKDAVMDAESPLHRTLKKAAKQAMFSGLVTETSDIEDE